MQIPFNAYKIFFSSLYTALLFKENGIVHELDVWQTQVELTLVKFEI